MSRILIALLLVIGVSAKEVKNSPASPDASEGKSVYVSPPPPVEVADEGCVQKEDQNTTGHGSAKWF
ncbi:hypothetical protein [Sulfuricurvum sp.]|uniref:hypothetical protein n=1 Tax=Sulfuricurvum sp. TaxID=2025608 RepID=UPI00286E68BE|nr:hypothetical protein [Sulfuricurvum sp.]